MSSSRLYRYRQKRQFITAFLDFVQSVSRSAGSPFEHGHPRAIARISADTRVDFVSILTHSAVDEGFVLLENRAIVKLIRESFVRQIVFRDDKQTRGVFVDPMY